MKSFLTNLEKSTSTGYTIDFGDKRNFVFKLLFLTIENVITIWERGNNQKMQLRKSLLLEMILIVQLKSNSSWKKKDEDCSLFPLEVTLIYTQNHSIASANAVKFNDVLEETKSRLAKSSECSSYFESNFDNVPQYWST